MDELLAISYSPWSEKARWALDARAVPYRERAYQPILGEPELRVRLKKLRGPVSVPVLITPAGPIAGSLEIARYAERNGSGPSLFPAGSDTLIADYDALSEDGLCAGRALALDRMLTDEEALSEQVPKPLRKALGSLGLAVARGGIERTLRKYGGDREPPALQEEKLRNVLETLRTDLAKAPSGSEPRTLLGTFSYADIMMSQVLAFVDPPQSGAFRIGRGGRRSYQTATLREAYQDLVSWRDALYASYRKR